MSEPKRIQRRRTSGWRMPKGAVYVGRGTKWGNPWRVEDGMSQKGAVWRYRDAIMGPLRPVWPDAPTVDQIRSELGGRDLACWCPLEDKHHHPVPCHADVLLELANRQEAGSDE